MPEVIAAFDVDGTLTTRDCVVLFLRRFALRPVVVWRAVVRAPSAAIALFGRDRDRLRRAVTRAVLTGVPSSELEREARLFADQVITERLRSDTVARLEWHVGQGHRVVLVSASYEVYLRHLAAELGAEEVLATRLDVGDDDRCTGSLVGANCRAAEKERRLREWLVQQGLRRGDVEVWAYGDSRGDRELLAFADHPIWAAEPLDSVAPTV